MPSLEVKFPGSKSKQRYELKRNEVILGRHPSCHVVLPEGTVSRQHARILRESDGYYIEDLGSHNGTLLNGEQIENRTLLSNRDRIQIKNILLIYSEGSQTDTPLSDAILSEADEQPSTILTKLDVSHLADNRSEVNPVVKLQAMLQITHHLGTSLDMHQVLPKMLDSVFKIFTQADRGYILLLKEPGNKLVPYAMKSREIDDGGSSSSRTISRTIARQVIMDRQAILSADAVSDQRFEKSESISDLSIRSMICAPLMGASGKPVGIIQVDTQDLAQRFSPDDLEVLANVATLAGQMIEFARLHQTQLEADRRERDVATAKQVQLHLMPRSRPKISDYVFYDYYLAAEGIGGDYFGYIPLPDGRIAIALGDVAGKGISAALLVARLCSDVRYCLVTTPTPAEAVCRLNKELSESVLNGRFITFALCVLDPREHTLVAVSAGHMPPLCHFKKTGEVAPLDTGKSGPPLGIDSSIEYGQAVHQLELGDEVLLYTDGISEALNTERELFGTKRISKVMSKSPAGETSGEAVLDAVEKFAEGRPQHDDICLVSFARGTKA